MSTPANYLHLFLDLDELTTAIKQHFDNGILWDFFNYYHHRDLDEIAKLKDLGQISYRFNLMLTTVHQLELGRPIVMRLIGVLRRTMFLADEPTPCLEFVRKVFIFAINRRKSYIRDKMFNALSNEVPKQDLTTALKRHPELESTLFEFIQYFSLPAAPNPNQRVLQSTSLQVPALPQEIQKIVNKVKTHFQTTPSWDIGNELSPEWKKLWEYFLGICLLEFENTSAQPFPDFELEFDEQSLTMKNQEKVARILQWILSNREIFCEHAKNLKYPSIDNKCVELFLLLRNIIPKIGSSEHNWNELRTQQLLVYFATHIHTQYLQQKILRHCQQFRVLGDGAALLAAIPPNSASNFSFCEADVFQPLEYALRSRCDDTQFWGRVMNSAELHSSPKIPTKPTLVSARSVILVRELLDLHGFKDKYLLDPETGSLQLIGEAVVKGDVSSNSLKAFFVARQDSSSNVNIILTNYLRPLLLASIQYHGFSITPLAAYRYSLKLEKHSTSEKWITDRIQATFDNQLSLSSPDDIVTLYEQLSSFCVSPHMLVQITDQLMEGQVAKFEILTSGAFDQYQIQLILPHDSIPPLVRAIRFLEKSAVDNNGEIRVLLNEIQLRRLKYTMIIAKRFAATFSLFCVEPIEIQQYPESFCLKLSRRDHDRKVLPLHAEIFSKARYSRKDNFCLEFTYADVLALEVKTFTHLKNIFQQMITPTVRFQELLTFCRNAAKNLISEDQFQIFDELFQRALREQSVPWIFALAFVHPRLSQQLSPHECFAHRVILQKTRQQFQSLGESGLDQIYQQLSDYHMTPDGIPIEKEVFPRLYATVASHLKTLKLDLREPTVKYSEISELVRKHLALHGKCWDSPSENLLFCPNNTTPILRVFDALDLHPETLRSGKIFVLARNHTSLFISLAQHINSRSPEQAIEHPVLDTLLFSILPRGPVVTLNTWCRQLGPSAELLDTAIALNNILLAYLLVYWGSQTKVPRDSIARQIRIPPEHPNPQPPPRRNSLFLK